MFLLLIGGLFIGELHPERRNTLYRIHWELRAGMSQGEVREIISRYNAPYLRSFVQGEKLILHAKVGLIRSCILTVTFRNGRISSARTRGEDGPLHILRDAPPDLVTKD